MLIWAAFLLSSVKWLDVPYVRQVEAGCGAASIAMVMQYWIRQGIQLDPLLADGDRIYEQMGSPKKGISGQALKQYLERQGFQAFVIDGEMKDLRDHMEKGRPLVVCLAPRATRGPLHYVVVVGLSDSDVTFHDPSRGKLITESLDRFQREWKATGNWTLLAVPRQAP
jgi:ABC-type bacteriocin/lantibiotic exporter with double-glycine peptidase domain